MAASVVTRMMLAVFALLLHGSQATTPTCNACSSYEYMETAGESYYCQDSNNKCWNSVDCTGVGSLCQVASSCPDKKYTWIGASAGTDDWCNSNCNHNPSFCPETDCSCAATTPSCSMDTSVCQCPYGPASQYCASDAECPNEGSYCMNGAGKQSPYVCHVPNKKLSMTVQLHNISSNFFASHQQGVFQRAIWSGVKNYIRSTNNIAITTDTSSQPSSQPSPHPSTDDTCPASSCSECSAYCSGGGSSCSTDTVDGETSGTCSCSSGKSCSFPSHHRRHSQQEEASQLQQTSDRRGSSKLSCQWIGASAGTDDWCNSNCNHNPSFCPVEDCSCSGTTPSDYCTKYTTNHHGQCDNDSKCKWWHGNGLSHCVASNICNPCSSYAFLQIGYPSYCQDSNNKCWSSADCTADDRLCTVGIPTTIPQCCASLCAVQPNTTDSSGGSSPAPSPSAPVVFQKNCTTDDDCGDDGNYCMNDETKTKPYVCHTTSVVMTFNVAIGNASRDLYNSASDTLNQHLGSDSRRGSDSRIVTLSNSVATASKVANMQLSKVTVLSKAQSYDEYCHDKTAAEGCVGDSSSSGLSTVAIVLIVLGCLLAVVAIVGGIWFYHSRRVGSGSLNESLLEDDGEDSYKRMPDIPNSQNTCHESAQTSIFDNP